MRNSDRTKIRIIVLTLIVLLFGTYIYYQSRDFFLGPRLSLTGPNEVSSTVDEERLTVSGTAKNISALTLNGGSISIDQYNTFSESLLLSPGFNIIEVTAIDRFDHRRTEARTIIYTPSEPPPPISTTTVSTQGKDTGQATTSTTTP